MLRLAALLRLALAGVRARVRMPFGAG